MREVVTLIGRQRELDIALAPLILEMPGQVLVTGAHGVGKTAFVSALMDDPAIVRRFAARRYMVNAAAAQTASAQILTNGGFEAGFSGWTRADQLGSNGTFAMQSGTLSPVNGIVVPAPPGGTTAAMTDSQGPGAHVLYQDFTVPSGPLLSAQLHFDLFIVFRHLQDVCGGHCHANLL